SMFVDGMFVPGGADYAEMFETTDGNPIDVGYFVTFDDESEKIRKATTTDDYILGIVSADPAVLADSRELRWKDKYVTDEWGRVQYHDIVIPAEKDKDGNVIMPERTEKQPILNPDWDHTREYIPRLERPEWVAVGLLGKLLVRDDGTCKVGGYCKPNVEGIATASNKGYRVMKRTGENQILVLLNLTLETTNIEQLKQLASDQQSVEGMEKLINLKEKSIEQLKELAKLKEQTIEQLKELAKLKDQGILTEEELQIQKQKLLDS
ncbi:MAG: peptidase G2 autoproteolytic cleavage domain-containing protein, partial [Bacillota bacterium]